MTAERRVSLAAALRAGAFAAAVLVACHPLTRAPGLLAGMAGAAAGSVLGTRLAGSRLRSWVLLAGAALASAILIGVSKAMVRADVLPALLGPLVARGLSEAVLFGALGTCVVIALRVIAVRRPSLAVIEVVAAAAAVVGSLAAHREGMVHRPLGLADWALSRGLDPVILLLSIGGAASLALAGLLLAERRTAWRRLPGAPEPPREEEETDLRRWPLNFVALLLLAILLASLVRVTGLPQPRAARDMGVTGKPSEDSGTEGRGRPSPRPGSSGGAAGEQAHPEGWSGPGGTGVGKPRPTDDMPLQDEYSAEGSQAPVAVVNFHADYSPPAGIYYFRQTAFSQFNGVRLVEATRDDVDRDVLGRFPTSRMTLAAGAPKDPTRRPLELTVGLLADHARPFALDTLAEIWPVRNPDHLRFRRAYGALSQVSTVPYKDMFGRRPGVAGWTASQWDHYTEWPEGDPRYRQLAETIVGELSPEYRGDALARAIVIKRWLEKQGTYSRRSRHAGAADPVADFLFGDVTGYCVHFAHAAALLLRSVDVPARVSGGYAVEEAVRGSGSALVIQGGDAHAWPEIALDGVGWVPVDITPEKTLDQPQPRPDSKLQQLLGQALREGQEEDDAARRASPWPTLRQILLVLLVLAYAALVVIMGWKAWRAAAPWLPGTLAARVAYRAALDRLADAGRLRRPGETREAFAERLTREAPSLAPLTSAHLAWALGSQRPADPEHLRGLAGEVAREVRGAIPRWRWILGLVDPISFLRVR